MSTTHEPHDELQRREEIRKLAEEFAQDLRNDAQPKLEDYLVRVDPSRKDALREELVGEEFAYRFGDATQNGALRYRPVARLGKGAFGETYRAVDKQLHRSVALKVLLRTDALAKKRFLAEASRQADLRKHNHLVEVYDSGTLPNGHPFVVMEYVDGGTLRAKLDADGKLDAETAARLVEQIALAVAAVHEGTSGSKARPTEPLVHRDLKPENILLDSSGDAYVADFGIAATVADLHAGAAGAGGTIAYMSPEQATAFRPGMSPAPVDTRSDVWALGVILYELLAGTRPYVSNKADTQAQREEILDAILRFEPQRLRDLSPKVPPELERLVGQCLDKNVATRIDSAKNVASQLRRWLESVSAIPTPLDFSARLDEARRDFSERPWLFDEVDAWPAHQNERLLLLTGELGSGKSAFLAELIHRNPENRILASHLCRYDWPESRSAAKFVRSLAGMLAQRVEGYRSKLADLNLREALRHENSEKDPVSSFENAVVTPIAACSPPGGGVWFVVVDALDEADRSGSPSIPDLVAQWARRLPPWLRLIVSVRRDALGSNTFSGHRHLEIDRDNADRASDIRDDIQRFVRQRLAQPNLAERLQQSHVDAQAATSTLIQKSEANYLYVAEALVAIERDQITFAELSELPPGLTALYDTFFRRQWPTRTCFANVRPVLEVLIAAREPMLEDLVAAATSIDVYELDQRLESLAQYLAGRPNLIRLRHQPLADWLAGNRGMYRVARNEGDKKLADACYREYEKFKSAKGHLSSYAVRHLPRHLENAEEWPKLSELLTNVPFLEAKVEAGMVFELIRDLRSASDVLPTTNQQRGIINEIASALSDQAAFLDSHRDHVFQCLYNATAPTWGEAPTSAPPHSLRTTVEQRRIASCPKTPWVQILRRDEPSPVPTFRFHASAITALAVLQTGSGHRERVASAAWDGSIVLWDSTGRRLDETGFRRNPHIASESPRSFTTRSYHYVSSFCWATNASCLVTGNTRGSVQHWRLTDSCRLEVDPGYLFQGSPAGQQPVRIVCVAVSPSGSRCAIVYADGRAFLRESGHIAQLQTADSDSFTWLAFSPLDDSLLIAATRAGKVRNCRFRKGTWEPWMGSLDASVKGVAFAPHGRLFACVTEDRKATCFSVSEMGDIEPVRSEALSIEGNPKAISISRDGHYLSLVTDDGEVLTARLSESGQLTDQRRLGMIDATCVAASTSQDASFYVGTRRGEVLLHDGRNTMRFPPMPTWSAIGWSREKMGTAQPDGTIRFLDLPQVSTLRVHSARTPGRIRDGIFFNHDNCVALAADSDELILSHTARDTECERLRLNGRLAGFGVASHAPRFAAVEEEGILTIWQADQQAREIASMRLEWKPSCVCLSRNGTLVAVGGQDATLFRVGEIVEPIEMPMLEWLRQNRPDLLQNSRLDERWLAEDGLYLRPHGDFSTEHLGISSVALSDDGSLLAMGFRSNTLACLPVCALEGSRTDIEVYQVPEELSPNTTRWVVELRLSSDGQKVAVRQSNGMGLVVDRPSDQWISIGWCAALGDWAFDGTIGLFSRTSTPVTEVRDLRTGKPLAFLPQPLELVGIGRNVDLFVARHRRNGPPILFRIER